MYLVYSYLYDMPTYDLAQGARVIPVFKRIGRDIHYIKQIKDVETRLRRALAKASREIDSCLFEILIANSYKKNGWEEVAFVSEESSKKTCDFYARKPGHEIYVECKRKSKLSDYSIKEKAKWLNLFEPVASCLRNEKKSIVLEIIFHEELTKLPNDYLAKVLLPKIPLLIPGVLVDDKICTIHVRNTQLSKTSEHLKKNYVRLDGPLLYHLLFDYTDYYKGITSGIYMRPHSMMPNYVDDIEWGYAAIWNCDSAEALFKKARSIKDLLYDAVEQMPNGRRSSVHLGMESYDGEQVEEVRLKRILSDVNNLYTEGKVDFLYLHFLAFTVPVDGNWDVREDCIILKKPLASVDYLLKDRLVIAEEESV